MVDKIQIVSGSDGHGSASSLGQPSVSLSENKDKAVTLQDFLCGLISNTLTALPARPQCDVVAWTSPSQLTILVGSHISKVP